jgi:benzil reductase ((S)-benzoin forming)
MVARETKRLVTSSPTRERKMNRIAFITGVSSGIGRALTEAYLERGFHVHGLSRRSPEGLESSKDFHFQKADLADSARIPVIVESLLRDVKHLDLAILNAGILGPVADIAETSVEEMRRVLEVNLWANKVILDSIFRLEIGLAQVVAISSGAGTNPQRGWNAYAISKAGLNMMISLYASERPETHFCSLAPGIVDTPMQDQLASLPADKRFPTIGHLRLAKGTPMMPAPDKAAPRLIEAIAKATKYSSGSVLDLRSLAGADRAY